MGLRFMVENLEWIMASRRILKEMAPLPVGEEEIQSLGERGISGFSNE